MIKTIPKGKKMQEGKVVVWGDFTNSWGKKSSERQERKGKYIQLNSEFQRIARRDKKDFLSLWCKEIEENNRTGKTRDHLKKIRDTQASLVTQMVKCLPEMQETQVWSLGGEDPQEKEMATHSSTFTWKIPWTEEPGRLQSKGLQRVRHDWATSFSRERFTQT